MTAKNIFFTIILFLPLFAMSQTAKQWQKVGDKAFDAGDHYGASIYYRKALDQSNDKTDLLYSYAESLRHINDYKNAAIYYRKVFKLDNGKNYPEASFWLAIMQKYNGEYKNAIQVFKHYTAVSRDRDSWYYQKAKQEIKSCNFTQDLVKDTMNVRIENIGDSVNTYDSEFAAVLFNDSLMYFSSLRTDTAVGDTVIGAEEYVIKIFKAIRTGKGWNGRGEMDTMINKTDHHTANGTFSADGSRFYFTRCDKQQQCGIFVSQLINDSWTQAEPLGKTVNLPGYTSTQPHVALVNEKEVLFFVSDRQGGYGKMDIWYSIVSNEGNSFEKPVNLGDKVNSPGNEITPYFETDSNRLYFSSDWHYGLGGFDIFKADGGLNPTSAENMNIPFNTSVNDYYFSKKGETGFLTSNRQGSLTKKGETCCNDIYQFEIVVEPPELVIADSVIVESDTLQDTLVSVGEPYFPAVLFFHNDEPNPRTMDTVTELDYFEAYHSYLDLQATYMDEFTDGLPNEEQKKRQEAIGSFFQDRVQKGADDLKALAEKMLNDLKQGKQLVVELKGFASPLAASDYNTNLSKRRISSVINYIKSYAEGEFLPYLELESEPQLIMMTEPNGEATAAPGVSDDLQDLKNSVFNIKAALERRVEVVIRIE